MDYNKIGKFIMTERKAKKLTQAKLAEKLFISEKTISKWESGRGIPDTTVLPQLCEIFGVTLNELLSGERIDDKDYISKAEEKIMELQQAKENRDRWLLSMEIVIGVLSLVILLSLSLVAAFIEMAVWIKIFLVVFGFVVSMIGLSFALKIEQIAGYYVCKNCGHKHIPSYWQVFFAPHINRTRYLKCPHCHKRSWNKKVAK